MGIIEALKNSIIEQFDTSLTINGIIQSLITACILAALISAVYRLTFSGVVFSRSMIMTIVLLTLATSMIIRTINANLSLSLGMVGALSIVRFRTAIKDPTDTAYLFWAVTGGIMAGAGLYLFALVGSLGIALILYLFYFISVKAKSEYLLVITYEEVNDRKIKGVLGTFNDKILKSKSVGEDYIEICYKVKDSEELEEFMKALKRKGKALSVNLVSYTNDFGM